MLFRKKQKSEPRRHGNAVAPKVHSYYTPAQQERIDIDMSSRRSAKRTKVIKRTVGRLEIALGVAALVFVAYMTLSLGGEPLINVINSSPGIDSARYSVKVSDHLRGSILNSNKLTLQKSIIEQHLKEDFPEIASIEVRYSLVGRRPEVYITVFKIPFIYEDAGNRYSVSEVGRVVGRTETTPTTASPLVIKDESGVPIKIGDNIITSGDVAFLGQTKSVLEQKGRRVEYMRITTVPREVYVKLTDTAYQLRMYLDEDPLQQVGSFFAAEKALGEGGAVPGQYIDVRAGEKVFWQ